jgi:hypothetical protein
MLMLTADLDVRLEFIPFKSWDRLDAWLNSGKVDIAATMPYLSNLIEKETNERPTSNLQSRLGVIE